MVSHKNETPFAFSSITKTISFCHFKGEHGTHFDMKIDRYVLEGCYLAVVIIKRDLDFHTHIIACTFYPAYPQRIFINLEGDVIFGVYLIW